MVSAGLRPTDPVRWYMAVAVERAIDEQAQDRQQAAPGGGDIQVVDDGA
jgi:hypothetical protein